jgi:hypothetical protein
MYGYKELKTQQVLLFFHTIGKASTVEYIVKRIFF